MAEGAKRGKGVATCNTLEVGRMAFFMARDAAASEHSVQRVLYIRARVVKGTPRLRRVWSYPDSKGS